MKVFFTALDWGLGHTARIIPIIAQYKKAGHHIIIGCSTRQKKLFQQHFDDVEYVNFSSISPQLAKTGKQVTPWISFAFRLYFFTKTEKRRIKKLYSKYIFNTIVSDNRYGAHVKACKNILITHQLNLELPKPFRLFTRLSNKWVHKQINRFDICWVPDIAGNENLAGKLSQPYPECKAKVKHIGAFSRLNLVEAIKTEKKDIVVLISGPENQRTVLEEIMLQQLKKPENKYSFMVLGGKPEDSQEENTEVINNIEPGKLKYLLKNAKYIFCRSGYSSIMDLYCLNRTAFLVPTPGQSEQEYLAEYLNEKGWFLTASQKNFNLMTALDRLNRFQPKAFPSEWAQRSIENFSIETNI